MRAVLRVRFEEFDNVTRSKHAVSCFLRSFGMKFILKAQASSTVSRLSAPRSSTKLASSVRSMPRFLAITARRRVRDLQGRVIDEINPNIVRAKDLWCCWYSILGSGKG